MTPARMPRWALSFADLCLLLLGFFVLLQTQSGREASFIESVRAAFDEPAAADRHDYHARTLFEAGEAVLKPAARDRFRAFARTAHRIRIESIGFDPGARRFDRWELAAARLAAVARALQAGGVPEDRIEVAMPIIGGAAHGQTISLTRF
jgi:hypothetical protein